MSSLGGFAGGLAGGLMSGMKLRSFMDQQQLKDDIKKINSTDQTQVRGPDMYSPEQQAQMQGLQDSGQGYYSEDQGWVNNDGQPVQGLQAPTQAGQATYTLGGKTQDRAFSPAEVQNWRDEQMVQRVGEQDPMQGLQARRELKQLRAADLAYKGAERADATEQKLADLQGVYQAAMGGDKDAVLKLMRAGLPGFNSNKLKGFDSGDTLGMDENNNFTYVKADGSARVIPFQEGMQALIKATGKNPVELAYRAAVGAVSPDHYTKMFAIGDKERDNERADATQAETSRHNKAIEGIYRDRNAAYQGRTGRGLTDPSSKLSPKDRYMMNRDDQRLRTIETALAKMDPEDPASAAKMDALEREKLVLSGRQYDRMSSLGMIPEGVSRQEMIDPSGSVQDWRTAAAKVIKYGEKSPEHFKAALKALREDADTIAAVHGTDGMADVMAGLDDYYNRRWTLPQEADKTSREQAAREGLQRRENSRSARMAPMQPWQR